MSTTKTQISRMVSYCIVGDLKLAFPVKIRTEILGQLPLLPLNIGNLSESKNKWGKKRFRVYLKRPSKVVAFYFHFQLFENYFCFLKIIRPYHPQLLTCKYN